MGDSPKKISMWKDVVRNVRKRLDKWRGVFVNRRIGCVDQFCVECNTDAFFVFL